MKAGYGSRKGSAFEREIAKDLSIWWSCGKSKDLFWRTHSSGSFGTRAKIKCEAGDLMSISDEGKDFMTVFNVECRHGFVIRVKDLIYDGQDKKGMRQFLKEGYTNARMSNRYPLWIFREQGMPTMLMMSQSELYRFTSFNSNNSDKLCSGIFPRYNVVLMKYEDWKLITDKNKIVEGANELRRSENKHVSAEQK